MQNSSLSHLLDNLNSSQQEAVCHEKGPALVLAGAGSGKTRVVTRRIAFLLSKGVSHHQIIALTFTNKAAGEMKERLQKLVSLCPWMGTFHSFGLKILREWSACIEIDSNFVIYDTDDCEKLLKTALGKNPYKVTPSLILSAISLCKNLCLGPMEVEDLPQVLLDKIEKDDFIDIYKRYEDLKRNCGAVDFDDLLYYPVKLFKEKPSVLKQLQSRYCYFLVDEYQDTNFCQYEFLRLLGGDNPNLFVVGDPDQSIYSWRGADIENILNFEKDFPGAKIIFLEENYRSSPEILEAASSLISYNTQRYEKQLKTTRESGGPIILHAAANDKYESSYVAMKTQELFDEGVEPHSIAIFYRTNFQSRAIEDALRRRDIPYHISGGVSFYQRKEIRDILAYLRLIVFDFDRLAFERALSVPKRGVGEKSLEKLFSVANSKQISVFTLLSDDKLLEETRVTGKVKSALKQFHSLIESLRGQLSGFSVHKMIETVIEQTNYLKWLQEDEFTQERMENLSELINKAKEWEEEVEDDKSKTLRCFLEEMNLGPAHALAKSSNSIALMTVHHAKGLEFDVVFVVGLEEMLFPHVYQKQEESKIEEERRLLYVAMTRARQKLHLCFSGSRSLWGDIRVMRPSRFLREMPLNQFSRSGIFF